MVKRSVISVISLLIVGAVVLIWIASVNPTSLSGQSAQLAGSIIIKTVNGDIIATIAATESSQERGLSGRTSLKTDEGMLFVFATSTIPYFWMKDMNFPLDMVWIDAQKEVVGVTDYISPDTFPKTFSPSKPILYVLEINAGAAEKFEIKTGTRLQFDITHK